MKRIDLCLYSCDAKKLADFYTEVFCGTEPKLNRFDIGSYYYRCSLAGNYQLDIFESSLTHAPMELSFSTHYPERVHEKLDKFGCKVENIKNIKECFDSEDIDGNKLHIIHEKMWGLSMPIIM